MAGSSPARPSSSRISEFARCFETKVLPDLEPRLEEVAPNGHTVMVRTGRSAGTRIIEIMTSNTLDDETRSLIKDSVVANLSSSMRGTTSVEFTEGEVTYCGLSAQMQLGIPWSDSIPSNNHTRLRNIRSSGQGAQDIVCKARNFYIHDNPLPGDSVGPCQLSATRTGTLGPLVLLGGVLYWLVVFHIFDDDDGGGDDYVPDGSLYNTSAKSWHGLKPEPWALMQPSTTDWEQSEAEKDPPLPANLIGNLCAFSGSMYCSTRPSASITKGLAAQDINLPKHPQCVTDWALCLAHEDLRGSRKMINCMRQVDENGRIRHVLSPFTKIMESGLAGRQVYSVGRTSGYQEGYIERIPTSAYSRQNGAGRRTREWTIVPSLDADDLVVSDPKWVNGGIGVPGDSGAPVVDKETNQLIGMVWGRNSYRHPAGSANSRRAAYFTAITDIFDDIGERYGDLGSPTLPVGSVDVF
jgi:hypothetical protein